MLPFFYYYDHYNYAKWGAIYIAEIKNLPAEIEEEFKQGNIVVKRSGRRFNQVDADQKQEWLNETGKIGCSIVRITQDTTALRRWALSYNLRSHIAEDTRIMYSLSEDSSMYNENTPGRIQKDAKDEESIRETLRRFNVFSYNGDTLQN